MKGHRDPMRLVMEWNRKYPIGTDVYLVYPSGAKQRRRTRSTAILRNGREAIIQLERSSRFFPLEWIDPVRKRW